MKVIDRLAFTFMLCLSCCCATNNRPESSNPDQQISAGVTLADVKAAISAATPGSVVHVPAGTCVWDEQLVINKSVSLIGAGKGMTTFIGGFSGVPDSTGNSLIYCDLKDDLLKEMRISGMTLSGGGRCEPLRIDNMSRDGAALKLRVDHCNLKESSGSLYWQRGTIYGVVDECIFDGGTINGVLMIYGNEEISWSSTSYEFGNADQLYFEDCIFNWASMPIQGGGGARYAIRHCTLNHTQTGPGTAWGLDVHGNYSWGSWSGFGVEVYENTWNMNGRSALLIDMRGGKGLVYNNYFVSAGSSISARVADEEDDAMTPPAMNPINGQPQHLSDFYLWNTYRNGIRQFTHDLPYVGDTQAYYDGECPRVDFHFWRDSPHFDGSSGMGVGTLSSRPAYCSLEGAAWWADNESKLYRWHNGAWELFYIPYTYPHPLRKIP